MDHDVIQTVALWGVFLFVQFAAVAFVKANRYEEATGKPYAWRP